MTGGSSDPLYLGVNSAYHESAAVIVRGREVVFALEEERLTRVKHAKPARVDNASQLPWGAIERCLEKVGVTLGEIDSVGYSLVPGLRSKTVGLDDYPLSDPAGFGTEAGEARFDSDVRTVRRQLAERAGDEGFADQVKLLSHHRCHAAGAFFGGPFDSAAALVIDGIGEHETAWLGRGSGAKLERLEAVPYPHSIGMLWEQLARYVGFSEYDAGKAMGLAAYGDATRFGHVIDQLFVVPHPDGGEPGSKDPPFVIDGALARFRGDLSGWESLFGKARGPDEELIMDGIYGDVAAAVQVATEEALLATARRLHRATGARNLVYAGGVALNCVANARLERHGPFEAIYICGPAHDAGTALGAALDLAARAGFARLRPAEPLPAALGPSYDGAAIDAACARAGVTPRVVEDPAVMAAERVAAGEVVAWFDGPLELGPRALGQRSLLADPRQRATRQRLNERVKHRELYRPFAASVLAEALDDWFEPPRGRQGAQSSRELMLLAYPVDAARAAQIPAVVHADRTCRIQTVDRQRQPRYHRLIARFGELTGVPLLLNTSFNDQVPIVCSPDDALKTFLRTEIDCIFLGDRFVER